MEAVFESSAQIFSISTAMLRFLDIAFDTLTDTRFMMNIAAEWWRLLRVVVSTTRETVIALGTCRICPQECRVFKGL